MFRVTPVFFFLLLLLKNDEPSIFVETVIAMLMFGVADCSFEGWDFRNHPIWKTLWMYSEVNKSVCTCGNNKWRLHKGFPVFVMIFQCEASCLMFQQLFIPYAYACSESLWFAMYNNLFFLSQILTWLPHRLANPWVSHHHPVAGLGCIPRPQDGH